MFLKRLKSFGLSSPVTQDEKDQLKAFIEEAFTSHKSSIDGVKNYCIWKAAFCFKHDKPHVLYAYLLALAEYVENRVEIEYDEDVFDLMTEEELTYWFNYYLGKFPG